MKYKHINICCSLSTAAVIRREKVGVETGDGLVVRSQRNIFIYKS